MNGNYDDGLKLWVCHFNEGFQESFSVVFAKNSKDATKMYVDAKVADKSATEAYVLDHLSVELGAPKLGGIVLVHSIYHGD